MKFARENYEGKQHLVCPVCGFEYTHLIGIKYETGMESITLNFRCEDDHTFSYTIYNHKGYTLIETS